ncbi:MAG: hypothetical protein K9M75_07210 [Phycisphaerae bacterium]|nr:hypothetical protein [Phycisphaerae bacterium]
MKKLLLISVLLCLAAVLCEPLLADSNIFSINFYKDDTNGNLTLEAGQAAGMDAWLTTGWKNIVMGHGMEGGLPPMQITSNNGSTATFDLISARNGGPYNGVRTTMLGDGNADMMDGHVNATEDPYDDSLIFSMVMSNITLDVYDVIIYLGGNWGDNTGKYSFNGGPVQDFTALKQRFDGTFVEVVNGTTPGNYIIFKGVSGSSFTAKVWGNGFNHLGPCGIQFGVTDLSAPTVIAGSDWATWSGQPVTLNDVDVTNNDSGAGELTYAWSAVPNTGVVFDSTSIEMPTVTITKEPGNPSTVTLTLTVTQSGKEPVESSMTIDVYDDACKAALGAGTVTIKSADFNANCGTGLEDLAQMAADWMVDYSLTNPIEK